MNKSLKILKIDEGIFKHELIDGSNFFTTKDLRLNIVNNGFTFLGINFSRTFFIAEIEVYNFQSLEPLAFESIDDLLILLNDLGYPLFSENKEVSGFSAPVDTDYIEQIDPDANGNYQTVNYKKNDGTILSTIKLTYDVNGNPVLIEKLTLNAQI